MIIIALLPSRAIFMYTEVLNMMEKIPHDELVAKINEFTKITRERDLTEEEAQERAKFREEYLRRIRQSVRGNLSGVEYKGNKK